MDNNEWTKVEDGLPEADGTTQYWVFANSEFEVGRLNEWGWHYGTRDTQNMIFGVTHWRKPIPPIVENAE